MNAVLRLNRKRYRIVMTIIAPTIISKRNLLIDASIKLAGLNKSGISSIDSFFRIGSILSNDSSNCLVSLYVLEPNCPCIDKYTPSFSFIDTALIDGAFPSETLAISSTRIISPLLLMMGSFLSSDIFFILASELTIIL